jgi:hypothetical protein
MGNVRALFFMLKCMKDFCSVVKVTMAIRLWLRGLKPVLVPPSEVVRPWWGNGEVSVLDGSREISKKTKRTTATRAILDGCSTDLRM